MRCTWHAITNWLDAWYLLVFFSMIPLVLLLVLVRLLVEPKVAELRRAKGTADRLQRPSWPFSHTDHQGWPSAGPPPPTPEEIQESGFGWLNTAGKLLLVPVAFVFAYPFLSSTFCENVGCKGHGGKLKPKTECVDGILRIKAH